MSKSPLEEMVQFLKPDSRLDLKYISLDHLVGLSGTEPGIDTLLKNEQIIKSVIDITDDNLAAIAKSALLLLVNITAYPKGAKEILNYKPFRHDNVIKLFISYVLDPYKKDADAACMILSNITRLEDELEIFVDSFMPHLNDILNAFVNVQYNQVGCKLDYLAPMFSNLSRSSRVAKWFIDENPHIPLIKLLPFCNNDLSNIRKGGAISTVRNMCFDSALHEALLKDEIDLLTYILYPLIGNEDYCDDEMDMLPLSLQYQPKEKVREYDFDICKMLLEILNKLCMKRIGRETLRKNGVYYILREYHKYEKDPRLLLACENVIDILIQEEKEVGPEDFSTVEVPDDLREKFQKMDEDYIKAIL